MARILCNILLVLVSCAAYAQSSGAEPPVEKVSLLAVGIFVVLFVAACVGYFAYTLWSGRKNKERDGK